MPFVPYLKILNLKFLFLAKFPTMRTSFYLAGLLFFLMSCNPFNKTIQGNGNKATESRSASPASKIDAAGSFSIQLIRGERPDLTVNADENLLPYILTDFDGDKLKIYVREGYSLRPSDKISVVYTTNELSEIDVAGNCTVNGEGKFTGNNALDIEMSGAGNVSLDVNYPEIKSEINGSGDIRLAGETRDSKIRIAGVGNYKAGDLKSENVRIDIAGSGDATIYASENLEVSIAGTGNVEYYGNPQIKQNIAGSGKIKKVD